MPVKHDLLQDLGLTKEAVSKFRSENPHLNQLFVQYGEKDAEVVEAEANDAIGVPDDVLRTLKEQHLQHPSKVTRAQIDNLRRRLHLTRTMQILGVSSLFLCVVTMFLLYVGFFVLSAYVFGAALLLLIGSLGVSIWEIQISVRALEIHLHDMEK